MIAVYQGSFDPITLGHEDIIFRASNLFDQLVIGVAKNNGKKVLLSFDQRIELVTSIVGNNKNITVKGYEGLTVNFVNSLEAKIIIRGMRSAQDYGYEAEMANINLMMNKNIETLLIPSLDQFKSISSSRVKEIYSLNGDISNFVSKKTNEYLRSLRK